MLIPLWIFKTLAAILIIVVLGLAVIGAIVVWAIWKEE